MNSNQRLAYLRSEAAADGLGTISIAAADLQTEPDPIASLIIPARGQSRRHSLLEASLNTASGFLLSLCATFVVYPAVGMTTTPAQNLWTTLAFTVISVVRSFVWRRVFNWWHHRENL